MKAKKMFLMILVSAIPFLAFAQEWDDIYATSKSKESKQKDYCSPKASRPNSSFGSERQWGYNIRANWECEYRCRCL